MTKGWLRTAEGNASPRTPGGIPILLRIGEAPGSEGPSGELDGLELRIEHARLALLRGYEELLCLEGLHGVERLPHQIETVRKVLRHFRGRVLLADEVGLGKTIEACMLIREYRLRGLARRVLLLVPASLVPQWQDELSAKFGLDFAVADASKDASFWIEQERVLASIHLAKSSKNFEAVTAAPWDLIVVDEAHHCKNRKTRNWQLVNALRRRHLFLLTATPVQNDLLELYNLLTLLEPGHLRTEADFKKTFIRRGNPRDPRNRARLRELLGQVMIRNTRSLVHIDLPPRYAQTFAVPPQEAEARAYRLLDAYLRWRRPAYAPPLADPDETVSGPSLFLQEESAERSASASMPVVKAADLPSLGRMQIIALLSAAGSHPGALADSLQRIAGEDPRAAPILDALRAVRHSAKEEKLLELLRAQPSEKILVFASFRATLERLKVLLAGAGIAHEVFSGAESVARKAEAIEAFRERVPVLLCSESGGEGHNLQFANTMVNFDLPWNPLRIEQRIGRIHRYGQKRKCFVFNLCTKGSLEERILALLHEKLRMFELVVGEVGSILGNLDGGDEFESLVLNLWLRSSDDGQLADEFERLSNEVLEAQKEYLKTKELDEALFGEDFE